MNDPTAAFFDDLRQRGHEPLLANRKGTVRIELSDGGRKERWFVAYNDGAIDVSKRNQAADATIHADKAVFDRIARGEMNAMAALLRGAVAGDGNWNTLVIFQRLFPSPPSTRRS